MLKAAICTIGDEILIGQVVDTNSSRISRVLNASGIQVCYMNSFGDRKEDILKYLDEALEENDIVIVTGGLGPTKDDITKSALAELFGSNGYYIHQGQLEIVREKVSSRGIPMYDINYNQASIPAGIDVIVNKNGTAPCLVLRFGQERYKHRPVLYSLPGVPFEAEGLLPDVMADIRKSHALGAIYHKTMLTFGIGESSLAKMIESWEDNLPADMHLAYLPDPTLGVRLRLSVYSDDPNITGQSQQDRITEEFRKLEPVLGDAIYGEGDSSLPEEIGKLLMDGGKTMSAAESCTGGRISELMVSIPGASGYYKGSVTSYDNSIKTSVLGVSPETIEKYGAVSQECVEEMAKGVLRLMKTDYSIATSGIAGPDGGNATKPVGTVWMACAFIDGNGQECVVSQCLVFKHDRARNIERFASHALDFLRRNIIRNSAQSAVHSDITLR